jgi:hypothetical protein
MSNNNKVIVATNLKPGEIFHPSWRGFIDYHERKDRPWLKIMTLGFDLS